MDERKITRRTVLKLGGALLGAAAGGQMFASGVLGAPDARNYTTISDPDICFMTATEMAVLVQKKKLSAREVMEATLKQIDRVNSKVNAIVTLIPAEQLLARAREADEAMAKGKTLGPLHGLPVTVKDLEPTKGVRTTSGSLLMKDNVPNLDSIIVEREKKAGAIMVGKSNCPEFGAGSQTFNAVFGPTLNPYDLTKTCGGSTGGGAVALACGMVPLADGSDMGGSLRNPGSFCNVVGLRPSPGRVPSWPLPMGWFTLGVHGPMARTVQDIALFMTAIAGPDPRSPISITEPGSKFAQPLARSFKGTRIAWATLGLPYERAVKETVDSSRKWFESLGCIIEDAEPDYSDANEIFNAHRAWFLEGGLGDMVKNMDVRRKVKDTVIWNIEQGYAQTGPQLARLELKRTALYHRVRQFMEKYEFIVLPVSQVLPFDVKMEYPTEIEGVKMNSYIDWMKSASYISTIGNPALSVPCGFSQSGLPVGVQIVGRHQDDFGVLQLGYAFQEASGTIWKRRPALAEVVAKIA
ncbi:MAG: amidase [Syntrophorhabdales bacterium]|jgi:amidase